MTQFLQRGVGLPLDLCSKLISRGLIELEGPPGDLARWLMAKLLHAPTPGFGDIESFGNHRSGVTVVVALKDALPKSLSISHARTVSPNRHERKRKNLLGATLLLKML